MNPAGVLGAAALAAAATFASAAGDITRTDFVMALSPSSSASPSSGSTAPPDCAKDPLSSPDCCAAVLPAPAAFNVTFATDVHAKGGSKASGKPFTVSVVRSDAPIGADRLYCLARFGYFTEAGFFRVVPGFVVQFGIAGSPAVSAPWANAVIENDPVKLLNKRGVLSYAAEQDAAGNACNRTTQVYINFADNPNLDPIGFAGIGTVSEEDMKASVDGIYAGYGQNPDQDQIYAKGDAYLKANFPKLNYAVNASVGNSLISAEGAWAMLETKLRSRYATVRRAFIEMDADKDGVISMKEFRRALEVVGLCMNGTEFRKLWRQFDTSGDGNISYAEFNNKIGRLIAPANLGLDMKRPETPKLKEWQRAAIGKQMAKKIKDIDVAFGEMDMDGSGRISHAEFVQALRRLGLRSLGDAETFEIMQKYKQAKPAGAAGAGGGGGGRADSDDGSSLEMTLDEFRAAMNDYLKVGDPSANDDPSDPKVVANNEAKRIIAAALPPSLGIDAILMRFRPFDEFRSKELTYAQFRGALEQSGARLSQAQFDAVAAHADPINDGLIDYERWTIEYCGGRPAGGVIHGGLSVFAPWARLGLRPVTNNATGRPYTRNELAERFAPVLGMSIAEAKLIQSLVGRKQDVMGAFKAFDRDGSGELSFEEFVGALSAMEADLDSSNELARSLFEKFDSNKNGRIEWIEWSNRIGGYMGIHDANLRKVGLEKMSAKEVESIGLRFADVQARRDAANFNEADIAAELQDVYKLGGSGKAGGATAASAAAGSPAKGGFASRSSAGRAAAAAAAADHSDAHSVATDALDLSPTGQKMKKILGRSWMTVAQDVQKRAASKSGAAGGAGGVPGTFLRDALAEKGVALTSKEVRAIASRYGPGSPSAKSTLPRGAGESGAVDVEKLFVDAVGGTMAGPLATVKTPGRK